MIYAMRAPFLTRHASPLCPNAIMALFFHSTSVLERRRNSQFRFNSYAMRFRRKEAKRTLLCDANMYLDHLLEGFQNSQQNDSESMSSNYRSWFEKQYFAKGRGKKKFRTVEFHWENYSNIRKGSRKSCLYDTDDEEYNTIFGSAFGGRQGSYWSFCKDDFPRGFSFRSEHQRGSWQWKDDVADDYVRGCSSRYGTRRVSSNRKDDSDNEIDRSTNLDIASDRLALGLTASGPLKLEEVKSAYRACALRWHPDRHQGSSKVVAEEKFKYCTAAYESICGRLVRA